MSFVRPEITRWILQRREVVAAATLGLLGIWLFAAGGYLLVPLGTGLAGIALAWGISAWRRVRFAQTVDAPGVVEVDEAQIGYLGPDEGGYVAIPDLVEIRLLRLRGRRLWQLRQADGQALLVPVDATGADRLFDAFATLPGMDTAALVAALAPRPPTGAKALVLTAEMQVLWRRGAESRPTLQPRP